MKLNDSSFRTILKLAMPALVQGLLTTIVFITDRMILAEYSEMALGSMQISGPVGWISTSLFGGFAVGMGSFIGRSWGADKRKEAAHYLGSGLLLSLCMGLSLGALGVYFAPELCDIMVAEQKTSTQLKDMALVYLYYVFPSAPFLILSSALVSGHQAIGNTSWPMYTSLFAGLVNLSLSAVLVHGLFGMPRLGVEGAAIGTAACYLCMFLANLAPILSRRYALRLGLPTRPHIGAVVSLSGPAFGERGLYHTAYFIFCAYVGHLGDDAMAVHQGLIAIESLGFISANAFGVAAFTMSAQHLGANAHQKARVSINRTIGLGIASLTGFGFVLLLFGAALIQLFVKTPNLIELGAQCLMIAGIAQPLMVCVEILSGAFRGAGDTKTPLWAAVIGPVFVRLASCWYLAFHLEFGLVGIWLGSTLDWVIRLVYLSVRSRFAPWVEKR